MQGVSQFHAAYRFVGTRKGASLTITATHARIVNAAVFFAELKTRKRWDFFIAPK